MKKKLLFIPLFAITLSGCSFDDLMFWKNETERDVEGQQEVKPQENNENKEEQQVNPDNNNQSQSNTPIAKTIFFYGSYLPSDWKAQGVGMDCTKLSDSDQNDNLKKVANGQVNDSNLLSELFFTKLNTAPYESSGLIIAIGTGNPAKGDFNSGTFTWTSTKKITKVELSGQCYKKELGAVDSAAHLTIEAGGKGVDVSENNNYQRPITDPVSDDLSFVVGSEETPTYKTYTKEYSEGINRFTLTSLEGRVLLKSLTITWIS